MRLRKTANESAANKAKIGSGRVWYLYVLECADGSLYCGIALDVHKRLGQHLKGKGARYTLARLPVILLHSMPVGPSVAEALKAERQFKALSRTKKLKVLKRSSTQLWYLGSE